MDQAGLRAHKRDTPDGATLTTRLPVQKHSDIERSLYSFTVAGAAPGSKRLCGANTPSPASLFHPVDLWPQST